MEEDLTTWLLGGTALALLVGTRVNWIERPQAENLPAVTLTLIPTASPGYSLDGARAGLRKARVQVDCWGATVASAKAVREAVEARMDAINLNAAAAPIEGCFAQSEPAASREELGGGGKVFRQFIDFAVWRRG